MKAYADIAAWREDAASWQGDLIDTLKSAIRSTGRFEETIKWGNAVFLRDGPVILLRHETERVILGFFRGKRLVKLEPRLKPSGKYELANMEWHEGANSALPTN